MNGREGEKEKGYEYGEMGQKKIIRKERRKDGRKEGRIGRMNE